MHIAVVGASNDPEKYGNRIVRHLADNGHSIYPVNLKEETILNIPAYKSIAAIPHQVDLIDIVVPPAVTMTILDEIRRLGPVDVWIQPGAESPEVIAYLEQYKDEFGRVTYDDCIMSSLERLYPDASSVQP